MNWTTDTRGSCRLLFCVLCNFSRVRTRHFAVREVDAPLIIQHPLKHKLCSKVDACLMVEGDATIHHAIPLP